ncbi:1981_t:CDS:2, partial [Cetraspora pellucida]
MSATNNTMSFQERKYTLNKLKMMFDKWENLRSVTCRRSIICAFVWTASLVFGSIGTLINSFLSLIKLFPIKKPDKESIDDEIIRSSKQALNVRLYETELASNELKTIEDIRRKGNICDDLKNVNKIQQEHPFGLVLMFLEELINNLQKQWTEDRKRFIFTVIPFKCLNSITKDAVNDTKDAEIDTKDGENDIKIRKYLRGLKKISPNETEMKEISRLLS